uniref:Sodium/calcium exchanger membrane region domain-containing protein n=1 Tax=Kalanchoe fedtschenkoi TaxID=63787 RepID=A0A7N0UWA3_KALFE
MGMLIRSKMLIISLNASFILMMVILLMVNHTTSHSGAVVLRHVGEAGCDDFHSLGSNEAKCLYLKSHAPCVTQGYIDYLQLFYCTFGRLTHWGYVMLFLWLLVLFYLLGDTASKYFSSALESLSKLLNLSPAMAGVTLLSLGNGTPDLFASLVSFMGSGTGDVGLNTVLGGASFVSCVVVGVICIALHSKEVAIDKTDFVRDVYSYIIVLVWLLIILLIGKINLWGSIAFASLYIAYVLIVYYSHAHLMTKHHVADNHFDDDALTVPILLSLDRTGVHDSLEDGELGGVFDGIGSKRNCFCFSSSGSWSLLFFRLLEMPLSLPRRLTIPLVSEEEWSKPYAVVSVTFSPILLAMLCSNHFGSRNQDAPLVIYGIGIVVGCTLGVLAFVMTEKGNPPSKCLFAWLVGSFLMSMIWSYITAQELVGLLVSVGFIFEVSSAILGLTVLAWGNSLGDLVTNLTIALNDGPAGAQIALSGCYAGPIFNILVGLGLSLVGKSWSEYPSAVVISTDPYVMETLGLLVVGLTWALVMLPRKGMKLNRLSGIGLLGVYIISISFRLVQTLGTLQL